MKIFIIEDDISVIGILEDIVERSGLGTVCGDSGDGLPDPERVLALEPDLILIDLLMPEKDGIQVVRELKERGCGAKFIMISQVSSKELIAKAYTAGVSFFIQKPINLIEVRQVITNIKEQIDNEKALKTIQSVFAGREAPASRAGGPPAQAADTYPQPGRHGRREGLQGHHRPVYAPFGGGEQRLPDGDLGPVRPPPRSAQVHRAADPQGSGAGPEPHRQPGPGRL